MKSIYPGLAILIFILTGSCEDNIEKKHQYQYTGYDSLGVKIIEGSLSIVYGDSTDITGQWNFHAVTDVENVGPQIGEGSFTGSIVSDRFSVNLNPNMDDNNVELDGDINDDIITGDWIYTGFPGILNYGTFEAEK